MTIREDIMRHGESGALRDDETLVREDIMQHGKSSTLREVAERTGLSVARVSVALDAISLAKEQAAWWREQQQREAAALLNANLRQAGFSLMVGRYRISLPENPNEIAIDRDGEGGHFSLQEFIEIVEQFFNERF